MNTLLRLFAAKVADQVSNEVKSGLSPLAPYLRRLSIGMLLVLTSIGLWLAGFIFLLISLFLFLSDVSVYLNAALWTAFTSFVLGFLVISFGLTMIRRPR